jgi:hypothetical protein
VLSYANAQSFTISKAAKNYELATWSDFYDENRNAFLAVENIIYSIKDLPIKYNETTSYEGVKFPLSKFNKNWTEIDLSKLDVGPVKNPVIDCWEFAYLFCYLYKQIYTTYARTFVPHMMHGGDYGDGGHYWVAICWKKGDKTFYVPIEIYVEKYSTVYAKGKEWLSIYPDYEMETSYIFNGLW